VGIELGFHRKREEKAKSDRIGANVVFRAAEQINSLSN
jgi:hypothetical protein